MWGIIPAAGLGSRIQPLAFSKELLPVGSRVEGGVERPRAVSEHLIERMIAAGADKLLFVIAPGKSDIVNYYGARIGPARIAYVVQTEPAGLCDAIFCACPFVGAEESVLVGLPDTIWFPETGLAALPPDELAFLLFPVERPEYFDAVATDAEGRVEEIQVKRADARSRWIWGAFRMPGRVLHALHALWREPGRGDEYMGTLVNAWLARGGNARGVRAGEVYVDVGTLDGYRRAVELLASRPTGGGAAVPFRVLQQRAALRDAAARPDAPPRAANDAAAASAATR
jgi:dTDP-glucose pyrophosphorylase